MIAESIAARFAALPEVRAIALAGSTGAGVADSQSDLDLYVYSNGEIAEDIRRGIACEFADRIEIGNRFWEPGDEWIEQDSGHGIDIMYRTPAWIEAQLERVLIRHEASVGYSTCFWWNVLHSRALHDPTGWYSGLQATARQPYPPELARAIVAKNHPLLCRNISSYRHQIESAMKRGDAVSVNHRVAAFLASYWDILFAVNGVPHPGEKRTMENARRLCTKLPPHWDAAVMSLLASPSLEMLDRLCTDLDAIL